MNDTDQDTDAWALDAGYVSVTPISYDLTAYEVLRDLTQWGLEV
jgi:5'-nucleotidase